MPDSPTAAGRVTLVGAGPGDPGLLTLRGARALAESDVVLFDSLANPRLLELAPPEALRVSLGRHGREHVWTQAEINARLIAEARAGRRVTRLKGGDPAVFARFAEETRALAEAGIPFEVVPGITAALGAVSHAGLAVTEGQTTSAVALVTGQERPGKEESNLDFAALARFPGTLVFYMGVTTARHWTAALIAAGKSATTPAAIVRRCTWPDQLTVCCPLGEVARELESRRLRPPVIVLVGDLVPAAPPVEWWFTSRPLRGVTVLATRAAHQAGELVERFEAEGAEVLVQPAIEIGPPDDWAPVDAALARLDEFDWLAFSSSNGVAALLDRLLATGGDLRRLGGAKLAAIGPGSAEALARYHLRADLVPPEYRAESLADALAPFIAAHRDAGRRTRCLLLRASRGREVLAERLRAAGAEVEQVVVYRSTDVQQPDPELVERLAAGEIDVVTVTSSAIARSLARLFGPALGRARLASISPLTTAALGECGLTAAIEAREATMSGLVEAVRTALTGKV